MIKTPSKDMQVRLDSMWYGSARLLGECVLDGLVHVSFDARLELLGLRAASRRDFQCLLKVRADGLSCC